MNRNLKQKRALYTKVPNLKNEKFGNDDKEGDSISGNIKGLSSDLCYKNSSGKWVCRENHSLLKTSGKMSNADKCNVILGVDYGYVEKENVLVGGVTCAWPDVKFDIRSGYQSKEDGCCANGLIRHLITYRILTLTTLGDNKMFVVSVGYKFSNDYVATAEIVEEFKKHEKGHMVYNACIKFDDSEVLVIEEVCGDLDENKIKARALELGSEELEKRMNEGQKKIDGMRNKFHEDNGLGGYRENYTCPEL